MQDRLRASGSDVDVSVISVIKVGARKLCCTRDAFCTSQLGRDCHSLISVATNLVLLDYTLVCIGMIGFVAAAGGITCLVTSMGFSDGYERCGFDWLILYENPVILFKRRLLQSQGGLG